MTFVRPANIKLPGSTERRDAIVLFGHICTDELRTDIELPGSIGMREAKVLIGCSTNETKARKLVYCFQKARNGTLGPCVPPGVDDVFYKVRRRCVL